jgi:putative addiction module killer protein
LLLTSVNDCLQYAHGDQTASNRRLPNPTRKNAFFEWQKGVRDPEARAAVLRRIERMRHGLMGDFKRFGVITELRIDTGPGYRLYIGQKGRVLVVLLLGGDKSTQSKDFDLARRYWNDYETRETAAGRSL